MLQPYCRRPLTLVVKTLGRAVLLSVLPIVLILLGDDTSGSIRAASAGGFSPVPTCALYTVAQHAGSSQLLAIDLRNSESFPVGEPGQTNIRALAIHPYTSQLYAASDSSGNRPGLLYSVDRATGGLTPIGQHGVESISALTFRLTDATLWGWAKGAGLVQIDPDTGAASLRLPSKLFFSGLAWNNDGSLLFGNAGTSLWSHREGDLGPKLVARNLPLGSSAIFMRSDDVLVGITANDAPQNVTGGISHPLARAGTFIYNPTTTEIVSRHVVPTARHFTRFEGLAWPNACGNASTGGAANIIQQVTVDPLQFCSGESVLVTVEAAHPESSAGTVDVSINGEWGEDRYLQFTGQPGPRLIEITAQTPEKFFDSEGVIVQVLECSPAEFLEITLRPNPFDPKTVDFEVANGGTFTPSDPHYTWDFGDGQTLSTTAPYAPHSYAQVISHDRPYAVYQAFVTMRRAGREDLIARKTVTVWNMYLISKRQGILQLPVEANEGLQRIGARHTATFRISNPEDHAVQLGDRRLTLQPCDPDAGPTILSEEAFPLEVPPGQQLSVQVEVADAQLAPDVCGLEVLLTGQGQWNVPAYASAYFEVQPNPILMHSVDDPAMRELLNLIVAQGLVNDPLHITDEDLYRLAREGKIVPPTFARQGRAASSVILQADHDEIIGTPCQPGDTPPRPGMSCQATDEWTVAPAFIANARKGDVLLSPGCGFVGNLLRNVEPPQAYSHTGIMTRDFYEVRHSTAAAGRPKHKDYTDAFTSAGSDGIRPDVLQYGWPGVITQSVDHAFNGESMTDPDGHSFKLDGFSADPVLCEGDVELVWPMIVKPPPGSPPSVREQLHTVADTAMGRNGHYRFYAYTNGSIAIDSTYNAPPESGWAAGTSGTVCSQFIWSSLNQAGVTMEGPVMEEGDVLAGAERDGLTLDGLYLYSTEERLKAGTWMYNTLYNTVFGKAGWFGNALTDAADDMGNQVANCFASDGCGREDKDHSLWRSDPGVGRAVSPDNILLWDGPDNGGVYGYSEPLVYRGGDYIRETVWQESLGNGAVAGSVSLNGNPVADASVSIAGLELFTGPDGEFLDEMIPAGTYEILASKFVDGVFMSVRQDVTIEPGLTTRIDLVLQPPPEFIRQVVISGHMFLNDAEQFGGPEQADFDVFEARTLDPFHRDQRITVSHCVGAEVRGELRFDLHLSATDNVTVEIRRVERAGQTEHAWLFEGTDCDTDDLDGWGRWHPQGAPDAPFDLGPGGQLDLPTLIVRNGECCDSDDYMNLTFFRILNCPGDVDCPRP